MIILLILRSLNGFVGTWILLVVDSLICNCFLSLSLIVLYFSMMLVHYVILAHDSMFGHGA